MHKEGRLGVSEMIGSNYPKVFDNLISQVRILNGVFNKIKKGRLPPPLNKNNCKTTKQK